MWRHQHKVLHNYDLQIKSKILHGKGLGWNETEHEQF